MHVSWTGIAMGIGAAWIALSTQALAQQPPAATIVIDGSGSMAGWLDGAKASKIDMVRAALAPALAKVPPPGAVGLMAFGHRRKGNCGDVEAIVAPGPGALEQTIAALPNIATTGKGPLVQALRQAAQGLGPSGKRSIILLHDDPDNCNQDACEAANAIAKSSPGLAIHVITLNPKPQTAAAMTCVTQATRGRQFVAVDEASLNTAVVEVMTLAALDNVPPPKPAVRPDAGPEAKLSEAGLVLTASLTSGGPILAEPVRWRITKDGAAPIEIIDTEVVKALPAGRYGVEARLGLATATQTIDVADGKASAATFVLQAGRIVVAQDPDGDDASLITVTRLDPARAPLFVGRTPTAPLVLPAGTYELRVDDGLTHQVSRITVAAGSDSNVGRPPPSGQLELEAVSAENGPPLEAVTYTIEKDDPDSPQGRREIARSAAPRPDFTLPAGTYYVTARSRQAEARQQLAISAGTSVRQTLVLALAQLTLGAKGHASLSPQGPALNFRVLSLDGGEREVARSADAAPVLTLPAGRYRIEAKLGSENARAALDTDLVAGKDAQVTLDIPAGQVKLDRAGGDGSIIEVEDAAGNVVWHAGAGETATALLAPGRYRYKTPDGLDKTFEVRAGDRQTLRLDAN